MAQKDTVAIVILTGLAAYLYYQNQTGSSSQAGSAVSFTSDPLASISDGVTSLISGWKNVGDGPLWVPVLNTTETQLGIPTDLLARVAYEESRFRPDIITGVKKSSAGALGLMQLLPQYFQTVKVPIPFTPDDTTAQIQEAGNLLVTNYNDTGSWSLALAAYNAGLGNVRKYAGIPPFAETQRYVSEILADVPGVA